ncbi:GntR family transcriptional regulator [Chthonobacter albigriseus]|uniref:GntR family transcriptional regulator n=1 Tax=Chthonobacter albigriseus TaxID=1683161 RepID=UPI0015EEF7AA|nr:GntR family transcriptional regulator [Chthonobacter albigriseus]
MARQNTVFKEAYNRSLRLLQEAPVLPSEPEFGKRLGVSRTTVRAVMKRLEEAGILEWRNRHKAVLRTPEQADFYPEEETDSLSEIIERSFMRRILAGGAEAGMQINELEMAREIGVGTSSVREFLIRFSRFGLIEKRRNSHWILKGFTTAFALELTEVREMFEQRSAAAFVRLDPGHPNWAELDAIEALHREILADIDNRYRDFSELDERFHRLVHDASHNRFIRDFYDVIAMIFHYHYQWNKTEQRTRNERAIREHLDYIAALKSRDYARVRDACERHLRSARETLLQSIPDAPDRPVE